MLVTNINLSATYNPVDAGYKNISVIRTIVCDPFLSFPIEKVPVIRTFFSTPVCVLITGIYCISYNKMEPAFNGIYRYISNPSS